MITHLDRLDLAVTQIQIKITLIIMKGLITILVLNQLFMLVIATSQTIVKILVLRTIIMYIFILKLNLVFYFFPNILKILKQNSNLKDEVKKFKYNLVNLVKVR